MSVGKGSVVSEGSARPPRPIGSVVAELSSEYPDITRSSLRFLEREGLVVPQRTAGGHRLYRPEDVDRLRQIKAWQRERLSLKEIRDRLDAIDQMDSPLDLSHQFLERAIAGERYTARQIVLDADRLGLPLVTTFERVLKPALYEVGDRWEAGTLSVGQEKEISSLAREIIIELTLRHQQLGPREGRVLAACVPGEFHELGIRMISGMLRAEGVVVYFLGPDVADEFLIERIQRRRPDAILLTIANPNLVESLRTTLERLRESIPSTDTPPIIVGGQGAMQHTAELAELGVSVAPRDDMQETLRLLREHLPPVSA